MDRAMIEQMRADLSNLSEGLGVMRRARKLVEEHVKSHGPIPKAQSLIDEIAAEMSLIQILTIDRADSAKTSAAIKGARE